MNQYGYPWWGVPLLIGLLVGLIIPIPVAFITGDWRYLAVSGASFILLRR